MAAKITGLICDQCGEDVSGPKPAAVKAVMERHMAEHAKPKRAKKKAAK